MAIPGVPNLLKNAPKAIGITLLGNLATKLWDLLFPGPTWGIFKVGTSKPAMLVSSIIELDVSAEARVSDYIIQSGSFTSYNKVRQPDIFSIRMIREGDDLNRNDMLLWLSENMSKTSLFDVLTPEFRYSNVTLTAYRVSRSARSGVSLIIADCLFQQVREKPVVFSSTTIAAPENQPASPTVRVFAAPPDKPITVGGPVSWR